MRVEYHATILVWETHLNIVYYTTANKIIGRKILQRVNEGRKAIPAWFVLDRDFDSVFFHHGKLAALLMKLDPSSIK